MPAITITHYTAPSVGPALRFPAPKPPALPVCLPADPPLHLRGIPAGVDGLVHEREGVLRAVSATVGTDGSRHEYLLTYAWADAPRYDCGFFYRHFGLYNVILGVRPKRRPRFQVLTCNCPCCFPRNAPACRHALAADSLLNARLVSSALLATHAGQSGPCEIVRAWETEAPCFRCGGQTFYVHLRRPVPGFTYRQNDRKTLCVNSKCGLWRHEA